MNPRAKRVSINQAPPGLPIPLEFKASYTMQTISIETKVNAIVVTLYIETKRTKTGKQYRAVSIQGPAGQNHLEIEKYGGDFIYHNDCMKPIVINDWNNAFSGVDGTYTEYINGLELNKVLLPHYKIQIQSVNNYWTILGKPELVPAPVTVEQIEEAKVKQAEKQQRCAEFRQNSPGLFKRC